MGARIASMVYRTVLSSDYISALGAVIKESDLDDLVAQVEALGDW